MSWIPIGPRFVFTPRDPNFQRLSRRNETGGQALVEKITIEPGNPEIIYVIIRPSTGGVALYRSSGAGTPKEVWISLADPNQPNGLNGQSISPNCLAINPITPSTIFMGTWEDRSVYVSLNRGATWAPTAAVGGRVRRLVIDPRTAGDPNNTVIYAATDNGLMFSKTSGSSWTSVPELQGQDVWSFCASMPKGGPDAYYAGALRSGLYTATDPAGAWTNLNDAHPGIGLPAYNAAASGGENFNVVYADLCPLDPSRVYLVLLSGAIDFNTALYMSDNATSSWSQVTIGATSPWAFDMFGEFDSSYGVYDFAFAVAPNSPGKGATGNKDVLFFGGGDFWRSIDGGATWTETASSLHIDHHDFEFYPSNPPAGTIPSIYFGTDGGLGASNHFCDPGVDISALPTDFDELDVYSNSNGAVQNYNHGLSAIAMRDFASHPDISALNYIAANDTSIATGVKTGVWRGFYADGPSGDDAQIAVAPGSDGVKAWYLVQGSGLWPVYMLTDQNQSSPSSQQVLTSSGAPVTTGGPTSVITPHNRCLLPMWITDANGNPLHAGVGVIDQHAVAWLISQDFSPLNVSAVCVGSVADVGFCATSDGNVWHTPSVSQAATNAAANISTTWTAIPSPPAGIEIGSIALDASNAAYVLAQSPVMSGGVMTALFAVSGNVWKPQVSSPGAPAVSRFGTLLGDPVLPGVLYTNGGGRVYKLTQMRDIWNWQDMTDDLPGQNILKMWIGNIGTAASPKVMLRAAIPPRGIWELETSNPPGPLPIRLYLRDNFLDQGLFPTSPDGVPSPYAPADPTQNAVHWICADIKVDAQQKPGGGKPSFYQTDPEGGAPPSISAIAFDCLVDNSESLPTTDSALVHVQVHNYSMTAADNVLVWAIYAPAAGNPPALDANFWSRFTVSGLPPVPDINHSLPSTSAWTSIGDPISLNGIDAAHPRVASWNWTVPLLSTGDSGHYCIVAFVHSAANPLIGTSLVVDTVTPQNRLVGQKNLHVVPMPVHHGAVRREYIEFSNPYREAERFDVIFNFRSLPKDLVIRLQFTPLETAEPLPQALVGIASSGPGTLIPHPPVGSSNPGRRLIQLPAFVDTIYTADGSARVILNRVHIPAFGRVAAFFSITNEGTLPQGAEYRFTIEQRAPGKAVGGSTYVVRTSKQSLPPTLLEAKSPNKGNFRTKQTH